MDATETKTSTSIPFVLDTPGQVNRRRNSQNSGSRWELSYAPYAKFAFSYSIEGSRSMKRYQGNLPGSCFASVV